MQENTIDKRSIKGTMVIDIVKAIRSLKNIPWTEHISKEASELVAGRILPSVWYPYEPLLSCLNLWPFYEKAQELGIVLDFHTGFCWVPPGKSKYALPILLDDVARDFPELKIVAFHMGYPYCDDLNMVALGHPNVYLSLSLLVPWALNAPRKFGKILGEALRFVGPNKILWGSDYAGFGIQLRLAVLGFLEFQFPDDLKLQYGYLPLTDEDKAKIFGLNLARLLGIEPKRRIKK